MPRLTVLIPCKDEAHNIAACIDAALLVADEVLVADSGSTDGTLDIVCGRNDCRLVEREFINYASFKNWALPQAAHEWVLIVDADERVTSDLADEIRALLASEPPYDAYSIRRRTFVLGYPLRYSGVQGDRVTRLVRRSLRYNDTRVHEQFAVAPERTGRLSSRLDHHTVQSLGRMFAVQNRYTSWAALDMHDRGQRVSFWKIVVKPPIKFMQTYLLRGGVLDGRMGFVWSIATAYYAFAKLLKLWEIDHSRCRVLGLDDRSGKALDVTAPAPRRVA